MQRSTVILATIALGAMLATGSATVSMARGAGGSGGGAHSTGSASGAHAARLASATPSATRSATPKPDPDMYGDYFCESPPPHNRFYGHDSIHHPCR
jgi:hypothetical protein